MIIIVKKLSFAKWSYALMIICFDIDGVICKTKKIIIEVQNLLKKQSKKLINYTIKEII